MRILSIETSCDETSSAVVEKNDSNQVRVLSNITTSSVSLHAQTGGIIPERAAREQVKWILPVIIQALIESNGLQIPKDKKKQFVLANRVLKDTIDAIAITVGPGLIGSLLVGVETAKTLSYVFKKPIIPVNHLLGHIYANFIVHNEQITNHQSPIVFPFIGLIASGGHTDLLLFKSHDSFTWLGGTRDDAAGEAMDKIGRMLGLPYPAGPEIEKRAKLVKETNITFHSPLIDEQTFDFSFSGLKTEVMRFVQKHLRGGQPILSKVEGDSSDRGIKEKLIDEICFAVQKAVVDVLVVKTIRAAQKYNVSTILLGGGVAANQALRDELKRITNNQSLITKILSPEKIFCTDNAAMIGAYAHFHPNFAYLKNIIAQPELYFD